MSELLEVTRATKTFAGISALRDVSLAVAEGERVGLIGPNGAGKTTLFNCLLGVIPLSSGAITHAGERIPAAHAPLVAEVARAAALCNDAELRRRDGVWAVEGDPMEGALLAFAAK